MERYVHKAHFGKNLVFENEAFPREIEKKGTDKMKKYIKFDFGVNREDFWNQAEWYHFLTIKINISPTITKCICIKRADFGILASKTNIKNYPKEFVPGFIISMTILIIILHL